MPADGPNPKTSVPSENILLGMLLFLVLLPVVVVALLIYAVCDAWRWLATGLGWSVSSHNACAHYENGYARRGR